MSASISRALVATALKVGVRARSITSRAVLRPYVSRQVGDAVHRITISRSFGAVAGAGSSDVSKVEV